MKGLKEVSNKTKGIDFTCRVPLYYSPSTDTVYTTSGEGRFHVTDLIRENTTEEIKKTVKYFMSL